MLVTIIAALKYRQFKWVIYPLYNVLGLFLVEVVLGRSATFTSSTQLSGTLHLAVALAILSLLILATVVAFYLEGDTQPSVSLDFHGPIKKLILALLAGLLLLITSGEFVVASGSKQSCKVWLTCSGQTLPAGPTGWIPFMHSLLAGLVSLLVITMVFAAWKIYLKPNQQEGPGVTRQPASYWQRVTAKRPVASGRVSPAEGLAYGVALCFLSFFIVVGFVNLLAALLSLAGMVYYVLIYSILLKKATVQNIVIGGGAEAIPPLVGWAAVTGRLNVPSLILFAIIFFWTPPHFWALALVRAKDYARAGVPMLPVIKGEHATRSQIFIYTLELVGLTLLLPLFKISGSVYLISALTLGGALIYAAWKVWRKGGNKTAWMMYRYSNMYLALLFFAMILDMLLRKPG